MKTRRNLITTQKVDQIRRMYRMNKKLAEIADVVGCSKTNIVLYACTSLNKVARFCVEPICEKRGCKGNGHGFFKKYPDELVEKTLNLFALGETRKNIAILLGVPHQTICSWIVGKKRRSKLGSTRSNVNPELRDAIFAILPETEKKAANETVEKPYICVDCETPLKSLRRRRCEKCCKLREKQRCKVKDAEIYKKKKQAKQQLLMRMANNGDI